MSHYNMHIQYLHQQLLTYFTLYSELNVMLLCFIFSQMLNLYIFFAFDLFYISNQKMRHLLSVTEMSGCIRGLECSLLTCASLLWVMSQKDFPWIIPSIKCNFNMFHSYLSYMKIVNNKS